MPYLVFSLISVVVGYTITKIEFTKYLNDRKTPKSVEKPQWKHI